MSFPRFLRALALVAGHMRPHDDLHSSLRWLLRRMRSPPGVLCRRPSEVPLAVAPREAAYLQTVKTTLVRGLFALYSELPTADGSGARHKQRSAQYGTRSGHQHTRRGRLRRHVTWGAWLTCMRDVGVSGVLGRLLLAGAFVDSLKQVTLPLQRIGFRLGPDGFWESLLRVALALASEDAALFSEAAAQGQRTAGAAMRRDYSVGGVAGKLSQLLQVFFVAVNCEGARNHICSRWKTPHLQSRVMRGEEWRKDRLESLINAHVQYRN